MDLNVNYRWSAWNSGNRLKLKKMKRNSACTLPSIVQRVILCKERSWRNTMKKWTKGILQSRTSKKSNFCTTNSHRSLVVTILDDDRCWKNLHISTRWNWVFVAACFPRYTLTYRQGKRYRRTWEHFKPDKFWVFSSFDLRRFRYTHLKSRSLASESSREWSPGDSSPLTFE